MIVVDASAVVAVLLGEPERDGLVARLEAERECCISIVSAFEAVMAVGRETGDRLAAPSIVRDFLNISEIAIISADGNLLERLAEAHQLYGKGSAHPARLNMGDCFSYATAKSLGVGLLYKGNDFAHTDLA